MISKLYFKRDPFSNIAFSYKKKILPYDQVISLPEIYPKRCWRVLAMQRGSDLGGCKANDAKHSLNLHVYSMEVFKLEMSKDWFQTLVKLFHMYKM